MSTGKLSIGVLALAVAIGGGIAALADTNDDRSIGAIELDDGAVRRDESADEVAGIDDDGTGGGDNTGDGDATDGNDGTAGGSNTGDVTYDAPAGTATGGGDTT